MRQQGNQRRYPRTARLNELVQQIIAEELGVIDDDRLVLVTVMSVQVDADLRHATVYVDTPEGADRDVDVLEALDENRKRLQGAVGRQTRLKRTPMLAFRADQVERNAALVEDALRNMERDDGDVS
jgi:ribosome-binding factor A